MTQFRSSSHLRYMSTWIKFIVLLGLCTLPLMTASRNLDSNTHVDLIPLLDFDVQVGISSDNPSIKTYVFNDLVTQWMTESFSSLLESAGYAPNDDAATESFEYGHFDAVYILERSDGTLTAASTSLSPQVSNGQVFTAHYKGSALFTRAANQSAIPSDVVEAIQRTTLIDDGPLLSMLQSSKQLGLGYSIVDVRALVADDTTTTDTNSGSTNNNNNTTSTTDSSSNNSSLQIVIIVAVIVAALAFIFLLAAVVWACQFEKRHRRDAFLNNGKKRGDGTGSDHSVRSQSIVEDEFSPVREVAYVQTAMKSPAQRSSPPVRATAADAESLPGMLYPESVVTDDIETSLSLYYRSGLGARASQQQQQPPLHDAASVSSMESYGYSLDGYTLGTGTYDEVAHGPAVTSTQQQPQSRLSPYARLGGGISSSSANYMRATKNLATSQPVDASMSSKEPEGNVMRPKPYQRKISDRPTDEEDNEDTGDDDESDGVHTLVESLPPVLPKYLAK